jgi:hypothetical protein
MLARKSVKMSWKRKERRGGGPVKIVELEGRSDPGVF